VPTCRECKTQKDNAPQHLLTFCPKYALLRHQFFGEAYPTMTDLIENTHPRTLIKFTEASGKLDEDYVIQIDPESAHAVNHP